MLITAHEHMLIKLQCCSITRHFCTVSANGMSCQFCGKQFNRDYNLRRHEKEYCPLRAQERNMSQTDSDSQERDFQDDVSTTSTHGSEISTDNDSSDEDEMDPWIPLIEEAKQRSNIAFEEMKESLINSGLDEQSAKDNAYSNILPELQKELENIYMERLVWMRQLKKDPVHKKIMQTKDALVENDDLDPEEAAIDKRKFLIKRLLKDYDFVKRTMMIRLD